MSRFLIEVPHDPEEFACAKVVKVFLEMGSHFLTNADWGCHDGFHSAWFIADVDTKKDALSIVPPPFRAGAKVIGLNYFTLQQIDAILARHQSGHPGIEPSH